MTTRVVHCGTGLTGREALRAIIEDPALELVGRTTSAPRRRSARTPASSGGLPPTGVLTTGHLDEVVTLGADCLCYAGDGGRELEASSRWRSSSAPARTW